MDSRETSASLRRKAEAILDATGWPALFTERFGTCALTGSARYDLMVWPDIDIHMPVRSTSSEPGRHDNRTPGGASARLPAAPFPACPPPVPPQ